MNTTSFPKIFRSNSTVINHNLEASKECLYLLLSSEKGELFGDPEFGIKIKKYTFEQNNYVLKDILIDEIFTQIGLFCPQLQVSRNDIEITQEKNRLKVNIKALNKLDFTTSVYNLVLLEDEER